MQKRDIAVNLQVGVISLEVIYIKQNWLTNKHFGEGSILDSLFFVFRFCPRY